MGFGGGTMFEFTDVPSTTDTLNIYFTYHTTSNDRCGFAIRSSDTANDWNGYWIDLNPASNNVDIAKRTGTSFTIPAVANFTINQDTDYEFWIEAVGTTINVYNSTDNRVTWGTAINTLVDSDHTSGVVGLFTISSSEQCYFDNIAIKYNNF